MSESRWPPRLPFFLSPKYKYSTGMLVWGIASYLYWDANHYPFDAPHFLPMTWIDRHVPFVPNTVWIYMSEYIFFPMVYITARNIRNLNKYLYSFFVNQAVSVAIFWLWPTIYPRFQFPLPDNLDWITHYGFTVLRHSDAPTNCCPSLHVSAVYLSSFIFRDEQKEKFPLFFIWGTLIALSTLTTKQHYLIDIVTGLGMALTWYWVFHRWFQYRPLGPSLDDNSILQTARTEAE